MPTQEGAADAGTVIIYIKGVSGSKTLTVPVLLSWTVLDLKKAIEVRCPTSGSEKPTR